MKTLAKDDLTGAALVALMRLSFAEQGIALPGDTPRPGPNQPHASLGAKEALATWVLARHGPVALLKVGQSVSRMAFDPIGAALLAARNGPDLIGRWSRLERYVHNRHPIVVRELTASSVTLAHFGDPSDPPSAAVDHVLAGVLAGLLGAVGCGELSLTIGEGDGAVLAMKGGVLADMIAPAPSPTGLWRFAWQPGERSPRPAPALFQQPDQPLGRLSREIITVIEADLVSVPTLADLARALGQSTRSLQRRLGEDGLSLQAIRRAAQIRRASAMLMEGRASLSSIGFACGFTDAAHFTRAFGKATGLSPRAFRDAAGRQVMRSTS